MAGKNLAALIMSAFVCMGAMAEAPDHGQYQFRGNAPDHYQTLTVLATKQGLSFYYLSESPLSQCVVPGIAIQDPHNENTYVFTNDDAHHLYERWEGYGLPDEFPRCQINLEFTSDKVVVKKITEYGCRSFCGARGAIGGTLTRVRP